MELVKGGKTAPVNAHPPINVVSCSNEFSYSTFGCRDEASLSFMTMKIVGRECRALLDSGSSRTFLRPDIVELLRDTKRVVSRDNEKRVTTATGQN